MKKTGLLLVLGLAAVLGTAAAPKANAGVVVGVSVGTPVYVHPARVYFGPRYVAPPYVAPAYVAPAPYVAFRAYPPVYRRAYGGPRFYGRWYGPRVVHRSYGWRR